MKKQIQFFQNQKVVKRRMARFMFNMSLHKTLLSVNTHIQSMLYVYLLHSFLLFPTTTHLKLYSVSAVRPAILTLVFLVMVHITHSPSIPACFSMTYPVTGAPPSSEGASQVRLMSVRPRSFTFRFRGQLGFSER